MIIRLAFCVFFIPIMQSLLLAIIAGLLLRLKRISMYEKAPVFRGLMILFNFLLRNELNRFAIRNKQDIAVEGGRSYESSVFFITLFDVQVLKNIGA